jgi:dihydrofolate synthase/folylpolyglutamate synthase
MAVVLAARRPQAVFLAEVGIGGRCDAVNALDARIAVVTHLSHDHRDVLGPTLDDIAYQKLGIARSDAPLVIARQSPAAEAAVARRLAAGDGSSWVLRPAPWTGTLGLRGQHQRENAATAAAVLELLVPGYDRGVVAQAWAVADLPARCQVVAQGGRTLLIDGAHNGPSVAATLAVAQEVLRGGFTVVLGLARDKEAEEVLAAIPTGTPVVRCGYDSPRARGAEDWPDDRTPWHASITSALGLPGDLCITGSFYLAAEALAAVGQNP